MNRSGIRTVSAEAKADILYTTDPVVAIGVRVNATGVTAAADGTKTILAGSALGSATSALTDRQTELSFSPTGTNVQGVTQHDIVFRPGEIVANANMIIFGFIDTNKLQPGAAPHANTVTGLAGKVTFINGK